MEHLDELVTRVLAPNPSPMTLDGTNTYVIGAAGSGEAIVLDPGPDDPDHLARVDAELARRDARVRQIVVTHRHVDHAEAAHAWARRFGTVVAAADRRVANDGMTLDDGDRIDVAGAGIEVVATPGHTRDHLSLRVASGALLTGDHVLGRGTTVVSHPDGDLEAYLVSLRRVLDLGPDALYPGHGPALVEDPGAVLQYYAEHRYARVRQLVAALEDGSATPSELVMRVYGDLDDRLSPAAEASTRAAIELLVRRGQAAAASDDRVALV